ncbi:MAG: uroporphyrinogen decarboxylase [Verrucomicrobia bacterium]|nr:MAG: uroporphyrinogen decarboxylase [Verrucomicrobiota bacterium]
MNRFQQALARCNRGRPPVWFMRQAGRYHAHYQALKGRHSFMELCKAPELACEVTLGPIDDFGFDAAILFSDLLFPLEAMGMGLAYEPGPVMGWHLRETADLARLAGGEGRLGELQFQADAMRLIRAALPAGKGLLGFVGGPWTLFAYAVEGSHKGSLESAIAGLADGRFEGFCERLLPLLAANMVLQYEAGADTVAVMDTCAGDLPPGMFGRSVMPWLRRLFDAVHERLPGAPITYYSKHTGPAHWHWIETLPAACFGVDWLHPLPQVMAQLGQRRAIQGNVDPHWLLLPPDELETRLRAWFAEMKKLEPDQRAGWICGLGHGVLPQTPESNVRLFLALQAESFGEAS